MMAAGGSVRRRQVTHVFDYLDARLQARAAGSDSMEGRGRRHGRGHPHLPGRLPAGQKYPLAVQTHGGPQAADKFGFGSMAYEIQVLAGKGYASCSRTIAAAPATATRSCATWSATTSRTRIST